MARHFYLFSSIFEISREFLFDAQIIQNVWFISQVCWRVSHYLSVMNFQFGCWATSLLFPSVTSCVFLYQSSLPFWQEGRGHQGTLMTSLPPLGVSSHWELPLCWPQPNTQSQRGPPVTALPHFQDLVLSLLTSPPSVHSEVNDTPQVCVRKKKNPEVPGEPLQVASPGVQMP